MEKALIIHGMPSREEFDSFEYPSQSNSHWYPWIQKELLVKGILAQTPEMPEPHTPDYVAWKETFEQFAVDEDTILVGHSCGGGFLVRWLSEHDVRVGKVVLVAPWLDPDGMLSNDFFAFEIDKEVLGRVDEMHVLYSMDDEEDIVKSVAEIKKGWPEATFHEFEDKGHFTFGDLGGAALPELREILLGK